LSRCWLAFLKQPFPFPNDVFKKVLLCMDEDIFPCLTSPLLVSDFLTDSFNIGGIIGILALNGIFTLITKHNLEYPKYYTKLYSLLTLPVFQAKYRQKFITLLNLSLLSSHVSGYLVAAFLKRLARISLSTTPYACVLICSLIFNILQYHPSCQVLLHRPSISSSSTDETEEEENEISPKKPKTNSDPYQEEELDPAQCHALHSSLWEIKTLCHHYCAPVAKMAQLIFQEDQVGKAPKPLQKIDDFLQQNYSTMMDTELKWHKKRLMPLAYQKEMLYLMNMINC